MIFKEKFEKRIFILSIFIRLCVLLIIFLLSSYMEKGFIASHRDVDDWRYEAGGEYYAQYANSLFDVDIFTEAFARWNDWKGYQLDRPFSSTPMWYWIVCDMMYITKTYWAVRILNILIAGFSSIYIYRFSFLAYGKKTARLATKLFTFLPYPVIFSCFSYKDHLVLLCTFYLLHLAVKIRYKIKIDRIQILVGAILLLIMMLTRSGLSTIFLGVFMVISFIKIEDIKKIINIKMIIVLGVILVFSYFFYDVILYKFKVYLAANINSTNVGNTISIVTITKLRDFYKLPFTYIFSTIMPIGIGKLTNSWFSIVANINILMIPIGIGGVLYVFLKRKKDYILFWVTLGYYLISIIMSTGIFRHYYSLLPLTFIVFADFITRSKKIERVLLILGTILSIVLLFFYYIFYRS
ncbi:MAG: hypothetical protein KGV57_03125 [Fusobacterium sp.]|nr:hypothetical protein [Fusobacterium sp.]